MACTVPNIDELINLIQNREMAYEIRPEDTYEDIEKRFKQVNQIIKRLKINSGWSSKLKTENKF